MNIHDQSESTSNKRNEGAQGAIDGYRKASGRCTYSETLYCQFFSSQFTSSHLIIQTQIHHVPSRLPIGSPAALPQSGPAAQYSPTCSPQCRGLSSALQLLLTRHYSCAECKLSYECDSESKRAFRSSTKDNPSNPRSLQRPRRYTSSDRRLARFSETSEFFAFFFHPER